VSGVPRALLHPRRANNWCVPAPRERRGNVGNILELIKQYAKQETVGPLRGAGRWIGAGLAGATCIGIGIIMLVLALLRALQEETGDTFDGNWSFVPYVITLIVLVAVMALAASRMRKPTIQRKEVPR
jgi:hypothetical protein